MFCDINLTGFLAAMPEKKLQTVLLFSVFVLQYVMEHIFPQKSKINNLQHEGFNLLVGIFNAAILFVPSALLVTLLGWISKNNIGLFHYVELPMWIQVAATIILMDFFMYWWHRLNHTHKFLWRFHRFHHRDTMMNTTTAIRFHSVELIFSVVLKTVVFLVIGFSFVPLLIYETIFFMAIVIHHSNIRITEKVDLLYRKLFSSPLMHRIHHSNKQQETDSNYGSVFSFWDRIFKTYLPNAEGPVVFGVDEKQV